MGQDLPSSYKEIQKIRNRKIKGEEAPHLGSYQNVFLSVQEQEALQKEFPGQADAYIEKLSIYMKQTEKRYADHAATIRKWLGEDQNVSPGYDYDHTYEEGECL